MKLILCASQYGGGKDTIANYLVEKLGGRWRRLGFADAVKKVFMDTFNVSWEFIEKWKRMDEIPPGFDMPIRQCLQFIGDGFRKIQNFCWIEIALRDNTLGEYITPYGKIISDGRYINEFKAIKNHEGINIIIWRKGHENNDPNPSESQIKPIVDWLVQSGLEGDITVLRTGSHHQRFDTSVEIPDAVKLFDIFIRNEGNLDELYAKVDKLIIPFVEARYGRT
jgi:hypothetical protein